MNVDFDLIPLPIDRKVGADRWTPPADIRIISADDHNLEADHLFVERLPKQFRDRAPRQWRDPETRELHLLVGDKAFNPPGVSTIGHECEGFWDRDARIRAMDSENVEASVLYHGQLMALNGIIGTDNELYTACMHVYNEWLAEYVRPVSDRLVGVAVLPAFLRPETARDEVKRIQELGYRALQMPSYPRGVRYNSREMDPLWEAIADAGIPLSFHVTATLEFHGYGSLGANLNRNLAPFRSVCGQLIMSGVLERHPGLQLVFAEGGASWVADAIAGMDRIFRAYYTILKPQLKELPSYYWRRQCHASFMDDPLAMKLIDDIGPETVMWSLDFPHPEGVFGFVGEISKSIYDTIGHEKAKLVLGGNAARVYKL
jgi:predicted TIM-barrel fold metal-dependent hydrolase